jgi:hypothetical protein
MDNTAAKIFKVKFCFCPTGINVLLLLVFVLLLVSDAFQSWLVRLGMTPIEMVDEEKVAFAIQRSPGPRLYRLLSHKTILRSAFFLHRIFSGIDALMQENVYDLKGE